MLPRRRKKGVTSHRNPELIVALEEQISFIGNSLKAGEEIFSKSPRYDFFLPHAGSSRLRRHKTVLMPFFTFEQFSFGPGRWLPSMKMGENYANWRIGFEYLRERLKAEYKLIVVPCDPEGISWPSYDAEADFIEGAYDPPLSPCPDCIIVDQEGDSQSTPTHCTLTVCGEDEDDGQLICAIALAHNEEGLVSQREYYPVNLSDADEMSEDIIRWAEQFGLDTLYTVEVDIPETCDCCGKLAGRAFNPKAN